MCALLAGLILSRRQYFLWLLEDKELQQGSEITITYGDEKGACEMLFSYGFLEDQMEKAETLFLSLTIPEDDPSRAAKMKVAECAPGFKIIDVSDGDDPNPRREDKQNDTTANEAEESDADSSLSGDIDWKGDFIWLLCITEEDGLRFEIARTVDGGEELQATFNGHELKGGAADLRLILSQTPLWPVYRLRAIVILQQRVFDQLQVLYQSQDDIESTPHGDGAEVRDAPYQQALKLRKLEFELLERAYEDFERQVSTQSRRSPHTAATHVLLRYTREMAMATIWVGTGRLDSIGLTGCTEARARQVANGAAIPSRDER